MFRFQGPVKPLRFSLPSPLVTERIAYSNNIIRTPKYSCIPADLYAVLSTSHTGLPHMEVEYITQCNLADHSSTEGGASTTIAIPTLSHRLL